RTVFARAALPIWATVRSTTLVYSSMTTGGTPVPLPVPSVGPASRRSLNAKRRAKVTRNCSPVDRTRNGRSQAGGDENPTEERSATTSLIGIWEGNPSRTDWYSGQGDNSS